MRTLIVTQLVRLVVEDKAKTLRVGERRASQPPPEPQGGSRERVGRTLDALKNLQMPVLLALGSNAPLLSCRASGRPPRTMPRAEPGAGGDHACDDGTPPCAPSCAPRIMPSRLGAGPSCAATGSALRGAVEREAAAPLSAGTCTSCSASSTSPSVGNPSELVSGVLELVVPLLAVVVERSPLPRRSPTEDDDGEPALVVARAGEDAAPPFERLGRPLGAGLRAAGGAGERGGAAEEGGRMTEAAGSTTCGRGSDGDGASGERGMAGARCGEAAERRGRAGVRERGGRRWPRGRTHRARYRRGGECGELERGGP